MLGLPCDICTSSVWWYHSTSGAQYHSMKKTKHVHYVAVQFQRSFYYMLWNLGLMFVGNMKIVQIDCTLYHICGFVKEGFKLRILKDTDLLLFFSSEYVICWFVSWRYLVRTSRLASCYLALDCLILFIFVMF